ncbi:MAG: two-component sensor histidine kinase [Magnetospirillum sp.]|nr:two-component sensor histidine kinase [Magnetospirillum sp.]
MRAEDITPLAWGRLWRGRSVAILIILVIIDAWAWQAWLARDHELQNAEFLTQSLARAAESQINGTMHGIERLFDDAALRIDPVTWPDAATHEWFRARLSGFPEISAMIVADRDGQVIGSTISRDPPKPPAGKQNIADRDYFTAIKANYPQRKFLIGRPLASRFSDRLSIPLVRALSAADGSFAGVLVAGLDPGALRQAIDSVNIEDEGGAAVFGEGATFLARAPSHDQYVGRAIADSPLFREHILRHPSGTAQIVSVADGNDKIVAYRTLEPYSLVVTVGLSTRTALSEWRRMLLREGLALGALAFALLGVAILYDRRTEAAWRLTRQLADSHASLERQVLERTAHLAASNAELEHFAYAASHDLQEPLRNVTSFLQLLSRRYQGRLDAQADEYITFAVRAAKQMSTLIAGILAYSRISRAETAPEAIDPGRLARTALDSLAVAVEEAGATIEIERLPAVLGSPAPIQSVFQNLIGNAVKYRAPDRKPQIRISGHDCGEGMVEIAVGDNGIGIEQQYFETIFGLFQRLNHRELYDGTGIGLALCRRVVESHGGRIWVDSQPDVGTTIRFTLRKAESPPPADGQA